MIINLTPHSIDVYPVEAFSNLEQVNPTTWVADSVDRQMVIKSFKSEGNARISTESIEGDCIEGIPTFKTSYGEAVGLPKYVNPDDILIVSLPMQGIAKH